MAGWAFETDLDIEYSHTIAPKANILLVETPEEETEGVQGFPQIVAAENYVIEHRLGDVISQSFSATEASFPSPQAILSLRSAYENAAAVALADQIAGHPLGDINQKLYELESNPQSGIVDVTEGENPYIVEEEGLAPFEVPGYEAKKGYDMASGLGTVNGYVFTHALAGK